MMKCAVFTLVGWFATCALAVVTVRYVVNSFIAALNIS